MGDLRTFLFALPVLASPLWANPQALPFPTCAGRLSALVEVQWLTDGPASDRTMQELRGMEALILASGADPVEALNKRVAVKAAFKALLLRGLFAPDPQAARRAEAMVAECRALMLG